MIPDPRAAPSKPIGGTATARWEALGTSVVLRVVGPLWLPRASAILTRELDAIDRACSRFRPDSDLTRVNAHAGGRPVQVAPLLIEALLLALRAAELTDGDVDPTVGAALVLAGYDRDWRLLERADAQPPGVGGRDTAFDFERKDLAGRSSIGPPALTARLHSGYTTVELDTVLHTVRVPRGIVLDLGATAKAWAADRAVRAIYEACGCGVLVSLGGDLATAGAAPAGGWRIHVTDDHRAGPLAPGQTVAIASGGLATSSTTVRRWRRPSPPGSVPPTQPSGLCAPDPALRAVRPSATMHHIIDPAAGAPVRGPWRTVSVAAASCADANIAATAALVRQDRAPTWLEEVCLPARLVAHDGKVLRVGGWPVDPVARSPEGERAGVRGKARHAQTRGRKPRAHPLGAQPTHADDPQ